jgi:hydrogenase nickel incorporation protein HypA/HybF
MHELSIISSVVDTVTESAAAYPGARVVEVRLRVGALASVVVDSLEFCWGIAIAGTSIEDAKLVVHTLPVVVWCDGCQKASELEGVQSFRCPQCGELTIDLRQGRELEIEAIEIDEMDEAGETEQAGKMKESEGPR